MSLRPQFDEDMKDDSKLLIMEATFDFCLLCSETCLVIDRICLAKNLVGIIFSGLQVEKFVVDFVVYGTFSLALTRQSAKRKRLSTLMLVSVS